MRSSFAVMSIVLVACAKQEQPAPAPPPPSFAGTWQMTSRNAAGDSIIGYTLRATGDTAGWSMLFPGREAPEPLRVLAMDGDSVVTEAGPYPSAVRAGVQVRIHNVGRLRGDTMVIATVARYAPAGADSVVLISSRGLRVP